MFEIEYLVSERPTDQAMRELWLNAWGGEGPESWAAILDRSLCYLCAYHSEKLVGFVNVAWDGGIHASIFDTCVHTEYRHQGIASEMVKRAAVASKELGAEWLHVDFEPHLTTFYRGCGFRPTEAGLLNLAELK